MIYITINMMPDRMEMLHAILLLLSFIMLFHKKFIFLILSLNGRNDSLSRTKSTLHLHKCFQ